MAKSIQQRRDSPLIGSTEKLLEAYYEQLQRWAVVLTRGDKALAEDIVQDLCLHFSLSRPDLTAVANLDGYLYICLRNMYLSGLTRSSREAMQMISIADFDSAEFALAAGPTSDLLERQNDLIRICSYATWRKDFSKSASYFILHFFHGYFRREVAAIARVPLSAIYNKLKIARTEIKGRLEDERKLQILTREIPPSPQLLLSPVPSAVLFTLLQTRILHARRSDCLPEKELLADYHSTMPKPVSCSLLSHLVSCERCLAIIGRDSGLPTLDERGALDGLGASTGAPGIGDGTMMTSRRVLRTSVQRKRDRIFEHRPRTLSIAVNGKTVASHDVQSDHSRLSSRIERSEDAQFLEVFSEQQIRMAFLPIQERPPAGSPVQTQRILLSDNRWLELTLLFDGLGLEGEVSYFDPTLAAAAVEEAEAELDPVDTRISVYPAHEPRIRGGVRAYCASMRRLLWGMRPQSALSWALVLTCIISLGGYVAHRYGKSSHLTASEILARSISVEAADLQGETEHQMFQVDQVSARGAAVREGTVELWRDGDGTRYVRRFYDANHRLLAADWHTESGGSSSLDNSARLSGVQKALLDSGLWKQGLSSQAFSSLIIGNVRVLKTGNNYELISDTPRSDHAQLVSTTLVLDHGFHPVRQTLRVRNGDVVEEVRFVESTYQRKSATSVPDSVFTFENGDVKSLSGEGTSLRLPSDLRTEMDRDPRLARLHIAVLYQLSELGADIGEPIAVTKTRDGLIRVSGTASSNALRSQIVSRLNALPDHQFLDLRLTPMSGVHIHYGNSPDAEELSSTVLATDSLSAPVTGILRRYFQSRGLSGEALDRSVHSFSDEALRHAQRALQDAYALDRLGAVLMEANTTSIDLSSQQQWTKMVEMHASDLENQLQLLSDQFAAISPSQERIPPAKPDTARTLGPAEFTQGTNQLLHRVQALEQNVGRIFASSSSKDGPSTVGALISATRESLPTTEANEIGDFASHLAASAEFVAHSRSKAPQPVTRR